MAAEVAGELAHEVDMEVCGDLLAQAGATNTAWSKAQPPAISLLDHYDSFYARLLEGSNIIYQNTRKVQANILVCGLGVAAIISASRNFVPSGNAGVGPYLLGTYGQFTVYVSPDFPANEYVLGYRGTGLFDAGYVYCPFIPITPSDLLRTDDLVGRRAWMMSYGKRMINSNMYCRGAILA